MTSRGDPEPIRWPPQESSNQSIVSFAAGVALREKLPPGQIAPPAPTVNAEAGSPTWMASWVAAPGHPELSKRAQSAVVDAGAGMSASGVEATSVPPTGSVYQPNVARAADGGSGGPSRQSPR